MVRVHAPRLYALGALDSKGPSPLVFSQQLGSSHEIARSKAVRVGGYGGLEQLSPDHLVVVTVHVGRCHVNAGMNALVVVGQQVRRKASRYFRVGGHVLVSEFLERVIKPFGYDGLGFPLGGIVVNAILVQQLFHVLVVKLFTLISLQLHGPALFQFVFQQVAQRITHGCAPFTLQR